MHRDHEQPRPLVDGLWGLVLFFTIATLAVIVWPASAPSHVLPHPKHMTLVQRRAFQERVIWHDRSVVRFYRNHPSGLRTLAGRQSLRWHRSQRGWTQRELGETLSSLEQLLVPHRPQWLCIHSYEGDWQDGEYPFIGGLQMDYSFAHTYGKDMIRRHGEPRFTHSGPNGWANAWTPTEQMIVAERAQRTRGFYPWPKTAHYCGLI